MPATGFCVVEFVGGPFDGHQQALFLCPDELNEAVLIPVGKALSLLNRNRIYERLSSMALYELAEPDEGGLRYRYLGAVSSLA